jgi:hypothetical protein
MRIPLGYGHNRPTFLLCIVALLFGVNGVFAEMTPGPKLCAARDLEVVILIEVHGAANDVAAERLAEAFLAQLDARAMCFKGHAPEATALYDNIISSLTSTRVGSRR